MALHISDIQLVNFRSYHHFELHDLSDLTVLHGRNAAGKTNIIEAIQMMTALNSFRKAPVDQMIHQNEQYGRVQMNITDGNRLLELEMKLNEGHRAYKLNKKEKNVRSLKGLLPSITFSPDDLGMVKGSDSLRRDEIDIIGSQVNGNYHQLIRDFRKTLKHRNALLKEEAHEAFLDSLTDLYVKVATQLTAYRRALLKKMEPYIHQAYNQMSHGEELTIHYSLSWEAYEDLPSALTAVRQEERERKQTIIGPHRDHIRFRIYGMDAGDFGSQGQQRSIVLAVKMAEMKLIEEMLDQKPILLLDDVMSELDNTRRDALIEQLLPNTQTFITTTNLEYFNTNLLQQARIIEIVKEK